MNTKIELEAKGLKIATPTDASSINKDDDKPTPTTPIRRLYRRRPLLVEGHQSADGTWTLTEAGREVMVSNDDFSKLYEVVDLTDGESVDAGLPDLEPGTVIEKDGKKLVRVVVRAGRGGVAYWVDMKPRGQDCQFRVTADVIDNVQASHRVGRFVDGFEGRPGTRTWVEVGK